MRGGYPEPDRGPLTPRRQDDSEVLVQLDDGHELPLGLRVQTFIVGQTQDGAFFIMTCCSAFCAATQRQFSPRVAARDLARYQRKGPNATTRMLRELLVEFGPTRGTLLDVGAGIGVLTFELLHAGFEHATAVDASSAYVACGRGEAARRRLAARVDWVEGNFVDLAPRLPLADVVTLDRVVCCYPAYEPLLTAALDRASHAVGLSYPRDRWYVRGVMALENGLRRLRGGAFRTFVHSPASMIALLRTRGFRLVGRRTTVAWSVDVFAKDSRDRSSVGFGLSATTQDHE